MAERIKETATSFYALLEAACADGVATLCRREAVRDVFLQSVDQAVEERNGVTFVGLFAKVEHCVRTYGIPHAVAALIHRARRELFYEYNRPEKGNGDDSFAHHLRATCCLVYYLCGRQPVPESLRRRFPVGRDEEEEKWGKFDNSVMRVVVDRWDDRYIWATAEQGSGAAVQICYGADNHVLSREGRGSWSYLSEILEPGAQLNLVRVRKRAVDEVLLPELIIYEPDYLVNITSVAACFESYAESPLVNIVNKIKPIPNTMAIHLGNLAGQLLDDTVHGRQIKFEDRLKDFVKSNALSMITCSELATCEGYEHFVEEARLQRDNINRTIGNDLPAFLGKEYGRESVVLEPSFLSEMLGIQGRMDYLYEHGGRAVVVEQKSGKGGFVSPSSSAYHPDVPAMREPHAVQALLYSALYQYGLGRYAGEVSVMLYYSRYAMGLLSIPPMPGLLLRAIRMRNLLAWNEINLSRYGFGMLARLTPDRLNQKHVSGRLWEVYVKPQLSALLEPIHKASPLELAYYMRFMRFIARESVLARLGTRMKENSGFAAVWHDTLEEKHKAGNIYDNLTLVNTEGEGEAVSCVTLAFGEGREEKVLTANFRQGDIVMLYPYSKGSVPNACAQMVMRASIVDISYDTVSLKLRNSQTDRRLFRQGCNECWAIEHDLMDSATGGLYSAMHAFLSAPKRRRDLLLFQRQPEVDESFAITSLRDNYGEFNALVGRVRQARDLFLVIGPPGTGKTSHGLVNILREELLAGGSVLLLSFTNRAVDEICDKLQALGLDYLRVGPELSCASCYKNHVLSVRCAGASNGNEVRRMLQETRVYCGTVASLQASLQLLQVKHFTLAIVDEASQILEPHLIGLLSAQREGVECIGRFVLIGDHKQLPAVVQQPPEESAVDDPALRAIHLTDCRLSLFERLLSRFRLKDGKYDPRYVYMLTRQGRMHYEVAQFPNQAFYGGRLQIVPLPHQTLPTIAAETRGISGLIRGHRMVFVSVQEPLLSASAKTNAMEASIIVSIVYSIYKEVAGPDNFNAQQTVGIIVPYRNQIAVVRAALDCYGVPLLHDVSIDTVERFQGSQRDYIIYGFTVHHRYQLNFLTANIFEESGAQIDRKLNVVLTRARLGMVLVGNAPLLSEVPLFSRLLDYVRSVGGYVEVKECGKCFTTLPALSKTKP